MRWHFCRTPAASGAENMALDEALMRRAARTGEAVFRVYSWSVPTLSLGRNQRARGCYDTSAARDLGVEFVRRPTGGRALLHHHEVTYSVTMAVSDSAEASAAYDFINEVLLGGLARLGVGASRATETVAMSPGLRPCFDAPADREVVVGGRKLIGSAQWRRGGALLQHGSILTRDDQPLIARLLSDSSSGPPSRAATLVESLGWEPAVEEVAQPIFESLEKVVGTPLQDLRRDAELASDATRLRETYEDSSWTWRR